ncbi:hypothetical protein RQP46_002898 [Phenoliferia psychrophenolica]
MGAYDLTAGGLLVATFLSFWTHAVVITVGAIYVAYFWATDPDMIVDAHWAYRVLVTSYGNPIALAKPFPREWIAMDAITNGAYTWLSCTSAADVLITGSMMWNLVFKDSNRSTQMKRSFRRIAKRTLQSNSLSLISQIVILILFKLNTGLWLLIVDFTVTKVYSFSLIYSRMFT